MMHLQKALEGERFCRALNVGPQVLPMHYAPERPLHERYVIDFDFLSHEEWETMAKITKLVGALFGWEYNSCESVIINGGVYPFDFANAVPDSSLMSLHFHFPWIVKSLVKWAAFCSVTKRKFQFDLHWQKYLDVAAEESDFNDKLNQYNALADKYYETEKFNDFCAKHLSHLDEAAFEYFTSEDFDQVIITKIVKKFPRYEHEEFIEHYRGIFRFWAKCEEERMKALV
jgi:hypothetical protein